MEDEIEVVAKIDPATAVVEDDLDDDELLETSEDDQEEDELAEEKQSTPQRRIQAVRSTKKYAPEDFSTGKYVVYPAHGVGQVDGIEEANLGDQTMRLIKISFSQERLSVRLPVQKINDMGLRPVSSDKEMQSALDALSKKKRIGRKMWSRRAQEYEAKINSGNPVAVAEVVRDLFRRSNASEQSFSERQLYKAALERFSRELAAVRSIDEEAAIKEVENILEVAAA